MKMTTTRTKEEQQLLDEKIARIQKKNEEILRRQKEIEEDKRLAEQQNALVKLRPSTVNVSRERTPALKPSKRELREDFTDTVDEPVIQRSSRGSFRGRGGERFRGQGDWKTNGPPPDPKSFLYDDERDGPARDRDGKGDMKREQDRKRSDDRDNRDENRGGREFQRGGRRGGGEYRSERGRQGIGRGRPGRNEEEAWRAERMRIDEARIQRQKSADGKWRREWDNEKITQELDDDIGYESRRTTSANQEQWRPPHDHHHAHHHIHQQHHHQCHMHSSPHGGHHHHPPHECPHHPQPSPPRGRGRGRGRLNPSELEMPLENISIEVLQDKVGPRTNLKGGSVFEESAPRYQKTVDSSPHNLSPTHQNDLKIGKRRSIECVGDTVKISIPNASVVQTPPKAQRKPNEPRGRVKSQTSYSSQSDDDSPRDRPQRGGRRQRNQKYPKDQREKTSFHSKTINRDNCSESVSGENTPTQSKPPLPPVKSTQMNLTSPEGKEGDISWEDVTTSGAESMGEELSSAHSSPGKSIPNMVIVNRVMQNESVNEDTLILDLTPSDYAFDEYLNQIGVSSSSKSLDNTEGGIFSLQDTQDVVRKQSLSIVEQIDSETVNASSVTKALPIDIKSIVDMKEVESILEAYSINEASVGNDPENVIQDVQSSFDKDLVKSDCPLKLQSEKEKSEGSIEENLSDSVEHKINIKDESDSLVTLQPEKEKCEDKVVENVSNSVKHTTNKKVESDCLVKLQPEKEKSGDNIEESNSVEHTINENIVVSNSLQKLQAEEEKAKENLDETLINSDQNTPKQTIVESDRLQPEISKSDQNIEVEVKNIDGRPIIQDKNDHIDKDVNHQKPSESSIKDSETQQLSSENTCNIESQNNLL